MGESEDILEGLKIAMEAELTGHNFYKNAAENINDSQAKAKLLELAGEELEHFKYLRHQYKSVLERGDYDFSRSLLNDAADRDENPIFSEAIKDRIKDSHFEVSVLTIGMKLELDAMNYYRSCAQKAASEDTKRFYHELADWEQGHFQAFQQELDALKEDYWQANNFVPT